MFVSREEINRMRRSVTVPPPSDFEQKREELKVLCDARVKKWPNTLEAMRENKQNWKKEKMRQEEERRQEIDREEAKLQKEARVATITKANDLIYGQTEKMKALRTQDHYSHLIKTRKAQEEEKKRRAVVEVDREAVFHHNLMLQLDEMKILEVEKVERRKERNRQIASIQQEQLARIRGRERVEREEEIKEGIKMKEIAEKVAEEAVVSERDIKFFMMIELDWIVGEGGGDLGWEEEDQRDVRFQQTTRDC